VTAKLYSSYKDSGSIWLNKVPAHWKVAPLKRLLNIQNGADQKAVESEEGYPIYGSGGIFGYANQYLYDGKSVLLGRKGTIDKPLFVDGKFWTVDTMYWSKILSTADPKFSYYLSTRIPFDFYSTSTALPSMTKADLGSHIVAYPEVEEQQRIANYLDRETVKIDELIHKQEELIKLLREERATRIKHAIKNGLKENVEMVSSSLIKGERVPKHWKVAQLKRNVEFLNNQRVPLSTEERSYRQGEYPYYGASGIIDYVDDYIYEESLILIGEDGANLLSRSSPLAFEAHGKYWVNNHAHILRPKDGLLDYWTFLLENHNYTCEVSGSAQPKLTIDALANIRFFTPGSIVEKREISDYCTSISQKIDCLIDKSRISIDLLREHRASLISAAVTGKIDVRELV
jgi:type I restriction enzyme S subunit